MGQLPLSSGCFPALGQVFNHPLYEGHGGQVLPVLADMLFYGIGVLPEDIARLFPAFAEVVGVDADILHAVIHGKDIKHVAFDERPIFITIPNTQDDPDVAVPLTLELQHFGRTIASALMLTFE